MSLLSSCFAYWPLAQGDGNNFPDSTPNGYTANGNGLTETVGIGPNGSDMLNFNGTSKRVLIPNMAIKIVSHRATINYWIIVSDNPTTAGQTGTTFLSSPGNSSHILNSGSAWEVYEAFGCFTRKSLGTIAGVNFQNLNMVTVTVDEGLNEFKYYINGLLKYQTTAGLWNWAVTQMLGQSSGSVYLKGNMSHVGLFNKALSATEILGLYNSGNGDFYPFASNIPDSIILKKSNKKSMFNFTKEEISQIVLEQYGKPAKIISAHSFTMPSTTALITDNVKYAFFGKVVLSTVAVAGSFTVKLEKTGGLNNGVNYNAKFPALPATDTNGTVDLENQLFNKWSIDGSLAATNFYFIGYKIQFD